MGFFSWRCAKSGYSIINIHSPYNRGVVMLLPSNEAIAGDYDGYGTIMTENKSYNILILSYAGSIAEYEKLEKELNEEEWEKLREEIIFGKKEGKKQIKLLLMEYYEEGMEYDSIPFSASDPNQGFFDFQPELIKGFSGSEYLE